MKKRMLLAYIEVSDYKSYYENNIMAFKTWRNTDDLSEKLEMVLSLYYGDYDIDYIVEREIGNVMNNRTFAFLDGIKRMQEVEMEVYK